MADFYTEMSMAVAGTPEELKALKDVFDLFEEHGDELDGWIDQEFLDAGMSISLERTDLFKSIASESGGTIGVATSIETDGEQSYLWIRHDESADVEAVAHILQDWLVETGSDKALQFEWANTASKPRLDSYGGGAVHITAGNIDWMNTSMWLSAMRRDMEATVEGDEPGM